MDVARVMEGWHSCLPSRVQLPKLNLSSSIASCQEFQNACFEAGGLISGE